MPKYDIVNISIDKYALFNSQIADKDGAPYVIQMSCDHGFAFITSAVKYFAMYVLIYLLCPWMSPRIPPFSVNFHHAVANPVGFLDGRFHIIIIETITV